MIVEYDSNNSGGGWWLNDDDWRNLERAGWFVEWGGLYFCGNDRFNERPKGKQQPCKNPKDCNGHRKYESAEECLEKNGRWLSALATKAKRAGLSLGEAIAEWESVTGKDSSDLGCACCGSPHYFIARGNDGKHVDSYSPEAPTNGRRYAD